MSDQIPRIDINRRLFRLEEARALLPLVRRITAESARQLGQLANGLERLEEGTAEFEELREKMDQLALAWAGKMKKLGAEVKGLWLVDFDNGQGYYCWKFPEQELDHFHGYNEGFSGRKRIC